MKITQCTVNHHRKETVYGKVIFLPVFCGGRVWVNWNRSRDAWAALPQLKLSIRRDTEMRPA